MNLHPTFVLYALLALPFLACAQTPRYVQGSGPELEQNLPPGHHRLQPGDSAPDFRLLGIDDQYHTLSEFGACKYLLVVFLSNHCPYSHAAETRLLPWIEQMKEHGLGVVAIQPNHPDALRLDELDYSKYGDSFAEMKTYAAEKHFSFPYLYDGETQAAAKAFGALATPDLFLFDEHRKLRYSGRFDDSRFADAKTVNAHDAINAMNDLLAGRPVSVPVTRPMGCSVKWLSKARKAAESKEMAWQHEPVTIEPIDAAAVAALARNQTRKLRLINVWATWCLPCVEELPEFARLSHRLARRNFEVITISIDNPKDQAKALKLLQDKHVGMSSGVKDSLKAEQRATNNYLYNGQSTDALVRSLDPQWPGPVPYTVLIAPGGQVVWRNNGALDPAVALRKVMDQLGVYYSDK